MYKDLIAREVREAMAQSQHPDNMTLRPRDSRQTLTLVQQSEYKNRHPRQRKQLPLASNPDVLNNTWKIPPLGHPPPQLPFFLYKNNHGNQRLEKFTK